MIPLASSGSSDVEPGECYEYPIFQVACGANWMLVAKVTHS